MNVMYLYPKTATEVSVGMELHGLEFVSQYPKMTGDHWKVTAGADGGLTIGGKQYECLSWETLAVVPWSLDAERVYCVPGGESEAFLEQSLATLGLNAGERNDCLRQWLPALERNPYNLIQFPATDYADAAELDIIPKPDAVLRVFMLFKRSAVFMETKPAALTPAPKRGGFTVVEWGAAEVAE